MTRSCLYRGKERQSTRLFNDVTSTSADQGVLSGRGPPGDPELVVFGRVVPPSEASELPNGLVHPTRSMLLSNVAARLSTRYDLLGVVEDPKRPFSVPEKPLIFARKDIQNVHLSTRPLFSTENPRNVSSSDLYTARTWILVAQGFQYPTVLLACETSLRLLIQHLATLPSLLQHLVVLKDLTSSLAVDASSVTVPLLKQLNLWNRDGSFRANSLASILPCLDDVIASGTEGKELATEFTRLSSRIRNALNSSVQNNTNDCHLNLELQRVVTNIRKLPSLFHFLLPRSSRISNALPVGGPVIIVNASKYSRNVLVVLPNRDAVHTPLQITRESVRNLSKEVNALIVRVTRANVTRELAAFLRELWDQIIIADVLLATNPPRTHTWWCPTTEFSVLPLHAAGSVSERRYDPSNSATQGRQFVAIGLAKATGGAEPLSVDEELDSIGQCVDALATFTRIEGEESCISRVVEELGKNEWVYLACHGLPIRTQLFESAFALHDGHFTIQQIIGCDLKNPEFAYLSACHTAVGDEESPDEVIHLASAMQFIGFRSVIGTM
ncbi:hypothetical protein L210DRAFT_3762345 [Boletus edulis BED1]|uniref:CHAT domain-containing protein n=1 Tax=Boletus edulis BED1 TaxID=1328754 RepID=A0AAD4GCI3_BOLED|nr:hypothetical protein L210DRAFT_3762345 [Boletus edulis BED1]